jgi:hypothetical protein
VVVDHQVQAIRQALQEVMPDQRSIEESPEDFDAEAASAAIRRLRVLLASCDGDAAEVFLAVEKVLAGAVAKSRVDALGTAISEFDFETALTELDKIAERAFVEQVRG